MPHKNRPKAVFASLDDAVIVWYFTKSVSARDGKEEFPLALFTHAVKYFLKYGVAIGLSVTVVLVLTVKGVLGLLFGYELWPAPVMARWIYAIWNGLTALDAIKASIARLVLARRLSNRFGVSRKDIIKALLDYDLLEAELKGRPYTDWTSQELGEWLEGQKIAEERGKVWKRVFHGR